MSRAMSPAEDDAKTLVGSRGRSTTVSSDVSIPKPTQSFSPRVAVRRPHTAATPRGVRIDFAALPAVRPSSPINLLEDPISKMESSPRQSPPRPKSCPMPLLAPPSTNGNKMATQASSLGSSTRPSSSRLSRLSRSTGLSPYNFPLRQPQPDPSWLPAATRTPPKPIYLKTARDWTTAIHGPLHPVIDLPRPPPTPNPQDLSVQWRRAFAPPEPAATSPLELVYDTRDKTFHLERRLILLPHGNDTPMLEMQENLPPLLVDGRMTVVDVPRWTKTLLLFWRSCDGKRTKVWRREVELPVWVWMARNFGERWKECFVR